MKIHLDSWIQQFGSGIGIEMWIVLKTSFFFSFSALIQFSPTTWLLIKVFSSTLHRSKSNWIELNFAYIQRACDGFFLLFQKAKRITRAKSASNRFDSTSNNFRKTGLISLNCTHRHSHSFKSSHDLSAIRYSF